MANSTREIWQERLRQWERSGLSCEAFAKQVGVSARTLSGWRYKIRREQQRGDGEQQVAAAIVEVRTPASPGPMAPLQVMLSGGRSVMVPAGFDENALQRLVSVLEAQP